MANSGFLMTDPGLADAAASSPSGPYFHINSFKVAAGYGYTPTRAQTALTGTVQYTGTPQSYTVIDGNTIDVVLLMDPTIGTFQFGEIGIYSDTNVLLAVCVFDSLQTKERTVGVTAGNIWRIHARLQMAQAPAICMIQVTNSSALLEVPNWQSLAAPINQLNGANAVIVHEYNSSADSILAIKKRELEWTLIDYAKILDVFNTDIGAGTTVNTITHPLLETIFFQFPSASSKYVIKFPNGEIRRLDSQVSSNTLHWTPDMPYVPVGEITIWGDLNTLGNVFPIATAADYNVLANMFNRYWAAPSGTYPTTNAGINQVAIPLMSTRPPALADWTLLSSSMRKYMTLRHFSATDIASVIDDTWLVNTNDQLTRGLWVLMNEYKNLTLAANSLDPSRNVIDLTYSENDLMSSLARARAQVWVGIVDYNFDLDYADVNTYLGLANAQSSVILAFDASTAPAFFAGWHDLATKIGSVSISNSGTASSLAFGTGTTIGLQNLTGTLQQIYTASDAYAPIGVTLTYTVFAKIVGSVVSFRMEFNAPAMTYAYGTWGTMNINAYVTRPAPSLINNPVLALPNGVQQTSTF